MTILARTGRTADSSFACEPAFQALKATSVAKHCDLTRFLKQLLVTNDFIRTVAIPAGSSKADYVSDLYQRPVQWILSVVDQTQTERDVLKSLIILSPYEANQLQLTIA